MKNMKYVVLLFTMFFVVGISEVYGYVSCEGDVPHTGPNDECGVGYGSPVYFTNAAGKKCHTCTPNCTSVITYLNPNGGSGVSSSVSCSNKEYACHASLPTPTKENCTFDGWYSGRQGKNLYSYADCVNNGETLVAQWRCDGPKPSDDNIIGVPEEIEKPDDTPSTDDNKCYLCLSDGHFSFGTSPLDKQGGACSKYTVFSSTSEAKCNSSLMPDVTPTCYSTITYKLNGGKFLDGSTKDRTQVIKKGEKIGEFKTNPIKEGYKFVCWADNAGNCYTKFNDVIDECKDMTLIAKYEEDNSKYCCENETDIYDPSKGLCYEILKTNENSDPFNFTTYTYKANERMCYAYYGDTNKPGAIYGITGKTSTAFGKNNKTDGVYEGYFSDAWRESNTCLFGTECKIPMGTDGKWSKYDSDCTITWRTILYKAKDSVICPVEVEEPGDIPESPDTGSALIYVAWAVGFGALGYSIYYLNKYKKRFNS